MRAHNIAVLVIATTLGIFSAISVEASPLRRPHPSRPVGDGRCTVPGSIYVAQVGGCVRHVTNVAEIRRVSPDKANDPKCEGKEPGFRYDFQLPDGGIAHQVCGVRR